MKHVQLIITAIFFIILYFPLYAPLARDWMAQTQNYSHGFLIPFISLFFLWNKKEELKKVPISPSGTGILIILAGLLLYLVAKAGYQFFFQCLSMVVVIFGII